MHAINIIKTEHKNLGAVLYSIDKLVEDPLFGSKSKSEFSELLDRLVNRLPAPLGLGDVWK